MNATTPTGARDSIFARTEANIPTLAPGIAKKINRLHRKAQQMEKESRQKLDHAVAAAWEAGKLLLDAKASVTRHGGRGAWVPWVSSCFCGGIRTAQRYMRLAHEIPALDALAGLSLRQAYFRLGIATEPKKSKTSAAPAGKLPEHITLANKLIRVLRRARHCIRPEDLNALYKQLRALIEK